MPKVLASVLYMGDLEHREGTNAESLLFPRLKITTIFSHAYSFNRQTPFSQSLTNITFFIQILSFLEKKKESWKLLSRNVIFQTQFQQSDMIFQKTELNIGQELEK